MAELQQISLGKLVNNTGQIAGVPKNPRQIRNEQYDKLLQSLKESDLTDYKPLMVYPQDGKFIVLFEGIIKPAGKDENGDIIYKYDK